MGNVPATQVWEPESKLSRYPCKRWEGMAACVCMCNSSAEKQRQEDPRVSLANQSSPSVSFRFSKTWLNRNNGRYLMLTSGLHTYTHTHVYAWRHTHHIHTNKSLCIYTHVCACVYNWLCVSWEPWLIWRDLNFVIPAVWNYQEALPKADLCTPDPACFSGTKKVPLH